MKKILFAILIICAVVYPTLAPEITKTTSYLSTTYVEKAGDTMTGDLTLETDLYVDEIREYTADAGVNFPNTVDATKINISDQPSAMGYLNSGAQTILTSTFTRISLEAESWDNDDEMDTSTYRYTATTAGKYFVLGQIYYLEANASSYCQALIYVNGTLTSNSAPVQAANADFVNQCCAFLNLSANDYVELYGYQTSGGNESIANGATKTYMSVAKIQ